MLMPCSDCCPQEEECAILFTDEFTLDTIGTDWTVVSGSWVMAAGILSTSSTDAILLADTVLTEGIIYIRTRVKVGTNGGKARIYLGRSDSSNHWRCELEPGAVTGTLRIYEVAAGVTTLRNTTTLTGFSANEEANVIVSYPWRHGSSTYEVSIRVTADTEAVFSAGQTPPNNTRASYGSASVLMSLPGTQCGLGGTGATVTFYHFTLDHCQICCGEERVTWPATMSCTITASTACSQWSQSFTMNKGTLGDFVFYTKTSVAICNGNFGTLTLVCDTRGWLIHHPCFPEAFPLQVPTIMSCDPFHAIMTAEITRTTVGGGGNCGTIGQTLSIEITE